VYITKKIGVVLDATAKDGGAYQYSRTVVKALSTMDVNADIYYIYYDPTWRDHLIGNKNRWIKYAKLTPLNISGALLRRIDRRRKKTKYYQYARPIYHKLKKHRIELLIYPCPMPWAAEFDIPSIVSIHDIQHRLNPEFPEVGDKRNRKKREYLYSNICSKAKLIFVDSELGKKDLVGQYAVEKDKIMVLPFVPNEDLIEIQSINVKEQFQLPIRYIFYPAQFWKHKNHGNLLRAISMVRDRFSIDVPLVLVGCEKNGSEEVNRLIRELDLRSLVFSLGYVSDQELVSLYRQAVALVMPTFFGPTNIPPLEAFMLGCPVLTSGISAIPEQVGDAALLFDPYDVYEMSEKILMVWTDKNLRKQLIMKGKQRAMINSQETFSRTLRLGVISALRELGEASY
jgi:glycosyltransferase involved in cell wall biosynthesis